MFAPFVAMCTYCESSLMEEHLSDFVNNIIIIMTVGYALKKSSLNCSCILYMLL